MSRRHLLQSIAASAGAAGLGACALAARELSPGTAPADLPPVEGPSLDALARAKGLRFGTALGNLGRKARTSGFRDPRYRALVARECSVLVPENETKWPQLCPEPDRPYQFEPADEMFAWARGHGMALRGHTLLWLDPKWLPGWVNRHDFGARPGVSAQQLLARHIATTCGHFGDTLESWDVVNEAIAPETGALRRNVFTPLLGDVGQVELAFRLAREHAPQAQLVYNDFMSWGGGNNARHRAGVLALLTQLRQRGAPVQALGIQAHLGVWAERPGAAEARQIAAEWRRFLDEVSALDLDLLVTELDVNDRALPSDTAERDAGVAATARDWLDATLDHPRVRRLLCWGLADPYSWLQDNSPPRADGLPRRALPYDAELRPTPLRRAIADALRAMPARPPM